MYLSPPGELLIGVLLGVIIIYLQTLLFSKKFGAKMVIKYNVFPVLDNHYNTIVSVLISVALYLVVLLVSSSTLLVVITAIYTLYAMLNISTTLPKLAKEAGVANRQKQQKSSIDKKKVVETGSKIIQRILKYTLIISLIIGVIIIVLVVVQYLVIGYLQYQLANLPHR